MCSTHGLVHWTKFEPKQNAIGWFTGKKGQKMWIFHILAIFFHFHTKSCRTFEGLTQHSVGRQKWSSYWEKEETICKQSTLVIYSSKLAQFCVKSNLAKMQFQNLCFGAKIEIFDFFSFLARNGSQMIKNHLVNVEWTIWTHFWPNLSIFQIFWFFSIFYDFHRKSCRTFDGLTHHSVGLQKWLSYWQKLETIC